jgi:hypothetical protein
VEINLAVVTQKVAEVSVEPLLASTDPILRLMDKGYSEEVQSRNYKSGDTIRIRIDDQPAMPVQQVQMVIDPIVQDEISATVLNYTTGWNVNTAWEALSLGEDKLRRYLKDRGKVMAAKAAQICYAELARCPGFIVGPGVGTAIKTSQDFGYGRAALRNQLADGQLFAIMSPDDMLSVAGDLAAKFRPYEGVDKAYLQGIVEQTAGLNFYETTLLPFHTNGDAVATGASGMALSATPDSGATTLAVSGGTSSGKITKGSVVYVPGSYEVNPMTREQLSSVRHYTVTEDVTLSGGAGIIKIFPPVIGPENPKSQTCSRLPVSGNHVGIRGGASKTYRQMLFFRKNSSALIGVKQAEIIKAENGMADFEGVPVQTSAAGDITNRQNLGRLDMLATARNTQWRHQYRAFVAEV